MSKRRNPQDKARIVMEFFSTNITAAELCRKHNVSPATSQDWKDKFLQGGKQALVAEGPTKNYAKEVENLKCIGTDIVIRLFFGRLSVRIPP